MDLERHILGPILAICDIYRHAVQMEVVVNAVLKKGEAVFRRKGPVLCLGQIWTQWILRHMLGATLVNLDICHFLTILGPFEYFLENGCPPENQSFLMKERLFRGFVV